MTRGWPTKTIKNVRYDDNGEVIDKIAKEMGYDEDGYEVTVKDTSVANVTFEIEEGPVEHRRDRNEIEKDFYSTASDLEVCPHPNTDSNVRVIEFKKVNNKGKFSAIYDAGYELEKSDMVYYCEICGIIPRPA
jgi:hypothetical protein